MRSTDRPRHARKDVRAFADWLIGQGWTFDGTDSHGHTLWVWPATTYRLTLPETPRGYGWQRRLRAEACRVMGVERPKFRGGSTHKDHEAEAASRNAKARLRVLAERRRRAELEERRQEQERRRLAAAEASAADDAHRREITSLMRPGFGR